MDITNMRPIGLNIILYIWLCLCLPLPCVGSWRVTAVGELAGGLPRFFSSQEGWAMGEAGTVLRTVDGGRTWGKVQVLTSGWPMGRRSLASYPTSARTMWVRLEARDGALEARLGSVIELAVTHDGGGTWRAEAAPSSPWTFEALDGSDEDDGPLWLGGAVAYREASPVAETECPQRIRGMTWHAMIYYRPALGATWQAQSLPVRNGCPVSFLRFSDTSHGVAVAGNDIFYTGNAGAQWLRSAAPNAPGIQRPVSLQLRGHDGWIGCEGGEVLYSADQGKSWTRITGAGEVWKKAEGLGGIGVVHFIDIQNGLMRGGAFDMFETSDKGRTWRQLELPERIYSFSCAERQCWLMAERRLYLLEKQ